MDKIWYCRLIIEIMEFVVKRIENVSICIDYYSMIFVIFCMFVFMIMLMQLLFEVSMLEMKYKIWDLIMQNFERENVNFKDKLDVEKKKIRV